MDANTTTVSAQPAVGSAYTTAAVSPPQQSTPSTVTVCPFIDKLSAELRVRIYQFVFPGARARRRIESSNTSASDGDSTPPSTSATESETSMLPISADIFAVNRLIHGESIEAFYNTTIIVATFKELDSLLHLTYTHPLIRDVEIVFCDDQPFGRQHFLDLLHTADALPRLKSFTILSDYLTSSDPLKHTVHQFVNSEDLRSVECTDIGKYKLAWFNNVSFGHRKLLQMWPHVASTPDDYDAVDAAMTLIEEAKISGELSALMAWASHESLRLWVGLLQQFADREFYGEVDISNGSNGYFELSSFVKSLVGRVVVPSDFKIHMLGPAYGAPLLELVTEMLSMNIQSYVASFVDEEDMIMEPCWVELGHESELKRQANRQAMIKEANKNFLAMADPVGGPRWEYNTMRNEMLQDPTMQILHGRMTIVDATRLEMHAMFKLHYAMQLATSINDYNNEQSVAFETWSTNLLRLYLRLAKVEEAHLIDRAPLHILRAVLTIAFSWASLRDGSDLPDDQEAGDDGDEAGETEDDGVGETGDNITEEPNEHTCDQLVRKTGPYIRAVWRHAHPSLQDTA